MPSTRSVRLARFCICLEVIERPAIVCCLLCTVSPCDGTKVSRVKGGETLLKVTKDRPGNFTLPVAGAGPAGRYVFCKVIQGHAFGIHQDDTQ